MCGEEQVADLASARLCDFGNCQLALWHVRDLLAAHATVLSCLVFLTLVGLQGVLSCRKKKAFSECYARLGLWKKHQALKLR